MRDNVVIVPVPDWPEAWRGWRFSRGCLVSPDGDKFTPERLRGIGWRQAQEARAAARRARDKRVNRLVTVVRIDQTDWHRERFGTVAG